MNRRFPVTIFLSAFLLFQVQPMMGRFILPWFGGTPAVWSVCLLFFQCLLLAGYAYAHWIGSWKDVRKQAIVHIGLLAISLAWLPVAPSAEVWKPTSSDHPTASIFLLLLATVGAPYFLLSATTPLLQKWFTRSELLAANSAGSETAGNAQESKGWRLYALSNFGSFLALFSYPFVLEPYARLHTQSWIWSGLYIAFAVICAFTAWQVHAQPVPKVEWHLESGPYIPRPSALQVAFWLGLAATASSLLLSTTNLITQDVAVAPFLWILPLSVYLLSFILTFESNRWYQRLTWAVLCGLLALLGAVTTLLGSIVPLWGEAAVYLLALFAACMVCHGELARARPATRYLTAFYLTVSVGGVLGGVFVALIAPHIFKQFTEYPWGLAAACALGLTGWLMGGGYAQWTRGNFGFRIPAMALLFGAVGSLALPLIPPRIKPQDVVRNFFGILWVVDNHDAAGDYRQLTHGRIKHGTEYLNGPLSGQPTTYFGPYSGIGLVMKALTKPQRNVAIIGLGAGTMAAWGRTGDNFRFYEINPEDELVARQWFTYLQDSKAKVDVVLGDARVQLERELKQGQRNDYDLIIVDAFSSDAIPMHLLTAECADIYKQRLRPGGMIAMHISNRSLNLEPVVRGVAGHLGWTASQFLSSGNKTTGEDASRWILLSQDESFVKQAGIDKLVSGWTANRPLLWTDDFASLWHVLIW